MNVDETLDKAADLIERDGWCQGVLRTATGEHCALGAIVETIAGGGITDRALAQSVWTNPDVIDARNALYETIGNKTIANWNDEPKRTKTEVVAALRDTAERVRQ